MMGMTTQASVHMTRHDLFRRADLVIVKLQAEMVEQNEARAVDDRAEGQSHHPAPSERSWRGAGRKPNPTVHENLRKHEVVCARVRASAMACSRPSTTQHAPEGTVLGNQGKGADT